MNYENLGGSGFDKSAHVVNKHWNDYVTLSHAHKMIRWGPTKLGLAKETLTICATSFSHQILSPMAMFIMLAVSPRKRGCLVGVYKQQRTSTVISAAFLRQCYLTLDPFNLLGMIWNGYLVSKVFIRHGHAAASRRHGVEHSTSQVRVFTKIYR